MKKLLTISIPTWNRALLLHELLEQLVIQIMDSQLEALIDIVVSDNCSNDNTWEIISDFVTRFSFIKGKKNHQNLGAKVNVLKSMELADSEYVMFLGDDDRIRRDCLKELTAILISEKSIGILIDISKYKYKNQLSEGLISQSTFFTSLYWYMGNAGFFICKSSFIKDNLKKLGYAFFNECWPQTQLMILGITDSKLQPFVKDLVIPIESKHDEVMIYSSYYLWRTCIYDLLISLSTIEHLIPKDIYSACRRQMKLSVKQNFFNVLQCGLFVDNDSIRIKTRNEISAKFRLFSFKENIFLGTIIIALSLPTTVSRPIGNLFIWLTRGKTGIEKKNSFVAAEITKKRLANTGKEVRTLIFEN